MTVLHALIASFSIRRLRRLRVSTTSTSLTPNRHYSAARSVKFSLNIHRSSKLFFFSSSLGAFILREEIVEGERSPVVCTCVARGDVTHQPFEVAPQRQSRQANAERVGSVGPEGSLAGHGQGEHVGGCEVGGDRGEYLLVHVAHEVHDDVFG